jgi:hypothetical protein
MKNKVAKNDLGIETKLKNAPSGEYGIIMPITRVIIQEEINPP